MGKILNSVVLGFFLLGFQSVIAQEYPIVVLPGEKKTIESRNDTLWILKDVQIKKAILSAKKLELGDEINKEMNKKISLLESRALIKDSLILDLKDDRNFYKNNWETCSQDVDILIQKNKRQKLYTKLSLGGIVVAFIAGLLLR